MLGRGVTSPPTILLSVKPVPPVLFEERNHARILVKVGEGVICVSVNVNVRSGRSKGYLASYLTSDVRARPVPPVHLVGWDHVLILVEVGEGDM